MKSLFRFAQMMKVKYASIDAATIKDGVAKNLYLAITHAAPGKLGIMDFISTLKQDDASMNINITRNGSRISVSAPSINNPELDSKYSMLPAQLTAYLERYPEVFPTHSDGQEVVYHNLTVTLTFP